MLTIIFIIVSFGVLGVSSVALVTGSSEMMSDEYHTQQAFDVAEAGLNSAAMQLVGDADWSDNPGYSMNFGPGAFTIVFTSQTATTATIQSVGTVEGISRTVEGHYAAGGSDAFDYSLYTAGDVDVTGSSDGTVSGPVSAGGTVDDESGVTFDGEITEDNDDVTVPVPDWDYWEGVAGTVITSSYNFMSGTYEGIYYIAGNVQISQDVTINGSIISTGDVSTAGSSNITITAPEGCPAIVAKGSIMFTGSSNLNITGWILSLSTVTFTGNSDVATLGGITAEGNIIMTGNTDVDIDFDADLAPGGDGFAVIAGGGTLLQLWREVY